MTEAEWLASDDPGAMLSEVTKGISPAHDFRISDRKLRLWVEACRAYSGDSDYVDDLCTRYGLRVALEYWGSRDGASVPQAVRAHLLRDIVGTPHRPFALPPGPECGNCRGSGQEGPCGLTDYYRRCSYCPPVGDGSYRGTGRQPCPWLTSAVVGLAQAAYEERDPDTGHLDPVRLAVLADALEEAGCDSEPLLRHLRGWEWVRGKFSDSWFWHRADAPHVRGCWAVDAVLGRE